MFRKTHKVLVLLVEGLYRLLLECFFITLLTEMT